MAFRASVQIVSMGTALVTGILALVWANGSERRSFEEIVADGKTDAAQSVIERYEGLSIEEQCYAAIKIRRSLNEHLMSIPPEHMTLEDWKPSVDQGYARLLRREYGSILSVGGSGGGAYFSFSTRSNDYQENPDLGLSGGNFSSGFHGGCAGTVRLVDTVFLGMTDANAPAELSGILGSTFNEASQKLHMMGSRGAPVGVGNTHVVRSIHDGETDVLAAVHVVGEDDFGVTIAWKILKRFTAMGR